MIGWWIISTNNTTHRDDSSSKGTEISIELPVFRNDADFVHLLVGFLEIPGTPPNQVPVNFV